MNERTNGGIQIWVKSRRIATIIARLLRGYSIEAHNEARRARSEEGARQLREEADEVHAQAKEIEQTLDPSKRV